MTEPDHVSVPREVYDRVADEYAQVVGTDVSPEFEGPIDRALLAAFVERIQLDGGLVADIGCGTGRIAAWLAAHGLGVIGVDMSRRMLAMARSAHPELQFKEGFLSALPFQDGSVGGAVYWYSIIHTPPAQLDEVFSELWRVLADGGHVLIAFQTGDDELVERSHAYGTDLTLINYRHSPAGVAQALSVVGLRVEVRAVREPELAHEAGPQGFIFARRLQ
ncbi:MAG: class I SAM-dependent DNA methyltransferase [Acidimicrobiales bacterium]